MLNTQINRLIHFGLQKKLIYPEDSVYARNLLLALLHQNDFKEEEINETLKTATPILEKILEYAVEHNLIEDTITEKDIFDTKIMNCLMPRPSEVVRTFQTLYKENPEKATEYFYDLSIASNYIRKDRTDKNIVFHKQGLDITINLSKPEKDPKEIAKAKLVKSTSYPTCVLCRENEGFEGNLNQAPRTTHRLIPLHFNNEDWFLQYSPYTYYNEHCIVFNAKHVPMRISKNTFANLLGFVEIFPHYFLGSNADLPIVGGSILSHDHYQGGKYTFPMELAEHIDTYKINQFPHVKVKRVNWPMSVIRLSCNNKQDLIDCGDYILQHWKQYSDVELDIIAKTEEVHNTITPIARFRNGAYELDLVLRNNRTNELHPDGIFHPHQEVHHIKKENIGLIEVMGLAVLPARLEKELQEIKTILLENLPIPNNHHTKWITYLRNTYQFTKANIDSILESEVAKIFAKVLEDAGVFKLDEKGIHGFNKFMNSLNQ